MFLREVLLTAPKYLLLNPHFPHRLQTRTLKSSVDSGFSLIRLHINVNYNNLLNQTSKRQLLDSINGYTYSQPRSDFSLFESRS